MEKAYKFELYPENVQINKINNFIGSSRFFYNHYLNIKQKKLKNGFKRFNECLIEMNTQLLEEYGENFLNVNEISKNYFEGKNKKRNLF